MQTMNRLLATVALLSLLLPADAALAGQKKSAQTEQNNKLTPEQVLTDCALTGALFSAATMVGLLKPATVAVHSMPVFSILHEALYGCGLGVASGFVGHKLTDLLLSIPIEEPKPETGPTQASAVQPQ